MSFVIIFGTHLSFPVGSTEIQIFGGCRMQSIAARTKTKQFLNSFSEKDLVRNDA